MEAPKQAYFPCVKTFVGLGELVGHRMNGNGRNELTARAARLIRLGMGRPRYPDFLPNFCVN